MACCAVIQGDATATATAPDVDKLFGTTEFKGILGSTHDAFCVLLLSME